MQDQLVNHPAPQLPTNVAELTADHFRPHVGDEFSFSRSPGIAFRLKLVEIDAPSQTLVPSGFRQPFTLIFSGPRDALGPQQLYEVSHPLIGTMILFFVPVALNEDGVRYAVVFN